MNPDDSLRQASSARLQGASRNNAQQHLVCHCRARQLRQLFLAIIGILTCLTPLTAQDPNAEQRDTEELPKMLVVPLAGPIDAGLVEKTRRYVRRHRDDANLKYILFKIDAVGGESEAAFELGEYIFRELRGYQTIAFIEPDKRALSTGALAALAANHIVMGTNSHLGAAPQQNLRTFANAGDEIRKRARDAFSRYASARGYKTVLAKAMVEKTRAAVFHVPLMQFGNDDEVEVNDFFTQADLDHIKRTKKQQPAANNKHLVLEKGELLTVDVEKALLYDFSEQSADDINELLSQLGIDNVPPQNIVNAETGPLRASSPNAQSLIDFLNHPVVRCVLLLGGCVGLLLEFKMLGTLLPGAIGLGCFALFFLATCFPTTGTTVATGSPYEIVLFVLGITFIGLELVFPGLAIFAIAGVTMCSIGIVMVMMPGQDSGQGFMASLQEALLVFLGAFGLGVAGVISFLQYAPSIPGMGRRGLVLNAAIEGVATADSPLEAQAAAAALVGRLGVTLTELRPAGRIQLENGDLVDVVSSGQFVAKGQQVRILESIGGRTVVEPKGV